VDHLKLSSDPSMIPRMNGLVRYLTHPQVEVDPTIAVPLWGLSRVGRGRLQSLIKTGWLGGTTQVISSAERKAVETAQTIAAALGADFEIRETMHENDRSATGFLPSPEFEVVADAFFAYPDQSIRGWERAVDAQARIVREVEAVLTGQQEGDILFVGHGAVGTLLFCHYAGLPIARAHDQPNGGGNYFTMTKANRKPLHAWRPMEMPPFTDASARD
jgi:broad specificity phosphatase PhoE